MARDRSSRTGWKRYFHDNGLSVVLFLLFVVFLAGQALSGWLHHNEEEKKHNKPEITLAEYVASGDFGESVFENWESEFLQMALYVLLTVFLFQRGSSESKDPDKEEEVDKDPLTQQDKEDAPTPVKKGGFFLRLYSNSLSLVFILLFLFSFMGHGFFGLQAYNSEALDHGQPAVSLMRYMTSSQFWFESFQNWQSEFIAIFSIVVLSIWLRQKGSPESKPVHATHAETGN